MTFVDHEGIIDRRTYREIAQDTSRWTSLLRSRGLVAGDRIVVLVDRTPALYSLVLGALKGGFVVVPCPPSFDSDELLQRFAHCDARAVVTDRAHARRWPTRTEAAAASQPQPDFDSHHLVVEDLREELRGRPVGEPTHDTSADDPAFILYTAGTCGVPKGAVHSHASTWMMRRQAEYWLGARPADLVWCTAETGSSLFVWSSLIGPWSVGSEIVVHEGSFDVEERLDLIDRLGVTVLCQPPSEYRRMAEHPELEHRSLRRVRHALSTGAPLDPETVSVFRIAFGVTIHDAYGQAETGILVASRPNSDAGVGSLGEPLPGYEIVVLDERGDEQAVGAEGEIALRGRPPSLFSGYWNDPDRTEAAFLADWYLPGDRARRDGDGSFWFAGRSDGQSAARRIEQERTAAVEAAAAAEANALRQEAAVAARAAEEARCRRAEEEERRRRDSAVVVTELDRGADAPGETAVEPPAQTRKSRREAAAERRTERANARKAKQQRKLDAKSRREEERVAAERARSDEAAAKRAAEARELENEQERKRELKQKQEQERVEERSASASTVPDDADAFDGDEARISSELIARLRAYGHGESSEHAPKDPE
jgi:acyl-coenzyme A synthetase/AMP-(fatty) acid ligase